MNIESQVTSLELSKKLKELGVKQESLWYWTRIKISLNKKIMESEEFTISCKENYDHIGYDSVYVTGCSECNYGDKISEIYSAFTASELLELLPENYKFVKQSDQWHVITNGCLKCTLEDTLTFCENLSNACAKMLIHLIENNLLENKK